VAQDNGEFLDRIARQVGQDLQADQQVRIVAEG
jgi:hypothetical protein